MINQEQIQANINSLILMNNNLLAQLKKSSVKIQTKDFDTEKYINSVTTNRQGVTIIEPTSKVSLDVASSTLNNMNDTLKKIQENCVAIKELSKKLSPYTPDKVELHEYSVSNALNKRVIKAGKIELFFNDNETVFEIVNNCLMLGLTYVVIKIYEDEDFFLNLIRLDELIDKFSYRGINVIPWLSIKSISKLRDYGDAASALATTADFHKLPAILIENSIDNDSLATNIYSAASLVKHLKTEFVGPIGCVLKESSLTPIEDQINIELVAKEFDFISFISTNPTILQTDASLFPNSKIFFICNYSDFSYYETMATAYLTNKNMIGFCIGSVEEDNSTNTLNPIGTEYASSIANIKFER